MYFVLAKNDDSSWKVVFEFTFSTDDRKNILDSALASNLPITVMETTSFKNEAKSGAVWNGTSFSGGHAPDGIDYMELPTDDDYWSTRRTYAFICDNVVIAMVIANDNLAVGNYLNENFAKDDIRLIKVPEGKKIMVGESVQFDSSSNTLL